MKNVLLTITALFGLLATIVPAAAQGTAFTYQGRLSLAGATTTGNWDIVFTLYDASSGGNQMGIAITNAAVPVNNGLFTVTLDFGANFPGASRWLEIAARTNGTSVFATVTPRQALTPVPYAYLAQIAGVANRLPAGLSITNATISGDGGGLINLSGSSVASGTVADARLSTNVALRAGGNNFTGNQTINSGYIGIGTNSPQAPLHVVGSNPFPHVKIQAASTAPYGAFLSLDATATTGGKDYLIYSTGNSAGEGRGKLVFQNHTDGFNTLCLVSNGLVGIGTISPGSTLDVAGDVHASGTFSGNGSGLTAVTADSLTSGTAIGSGAGISVAGTRSFVGGGSGNVINNANYAFVGGGVNNVIGNASLESTVSGGGGNVIAPSCQAATIGGGYGGLINTNADYATISGGNGNTINTNANYASIGGGLNNNIGASATYASIGGGLNNAIGVGDNYAVIAGGRLNASGDSTVYGTISGGFSQTIGTNSPYATIGGGNNNTILNNAAASTIPGGQNNIATNLAFAAGNNAQALNTGSFVWSDGNGTATKSTANNQYMARASGGYVFYTGTGSAGAQLAAGATAWTTISDRNAKKNFQPVNEETVLDKLAAIPIEHWNYKWENDSDTPNIGPMAQDFKAAFYPGREDTGISTLEFDGVELAAIQGLNRKLDERDAEIRQLKQNVEDLKQMVQSLAAKK